jgi:sec-independent protein translocase protein TatA
MFGVGTPELIIILVIILMVFGVGKLPQVAKMLGSGVKSFKDGVNGDEEDASKSAKKAEPELLDGDNVVDANLNDHKKRSENAW